MSKLILGLIVVVVVLAGGYYLLQGKSATAPTAGEVPQAAPSEAMEAAPTGAAAEEVTVTLTEDGYSPASVTVKPGTKVTWKNMSGKTATVSSAPHPTHTDYPPLNLGSFADGESHTLTFDKAGTYGYHNHFDASQKGTIVVE